MKKYLLLFIIAIILVSGLSVYQYRHFNDGRLHIIFCDVGQGDGILIVTPENKYILVDAGPDKKILECLSRHMSFWERTIDLVILTHPHFDHFFGMQYVADQYTVKAFATEDLSNKSDSFEEFNTKVSERNIPRRYVLSGDRWRFPDGVIVTIEGPTEKFLDRTSPGGEIGESNEFASIITSVSYKDFDVLLTGDSQAGGVSEAIGQISEDIEILQVPHHGSVTGLTDDLLDRIDPNLAVISVGAKNRYGHPKGEILNLIELNNIKTVRTDEVGDVEIVSDGTNWQVVD